MDCHWYTPVLHVFFPILREILWCGLVAEAIPYTLRFQYWSSLQSLSLSLPFAPPSLSTIRKHNISVSSTTLTPKTGFVHSKTMGAATCMHGWMVQPTPMFYYECIFKQNAQCCRKELRGKFSFFRTMFKAEKVILNTICPWSRDYNPYRCFPLAKDILIHARMVTRSRSSPDYVSPVLISHYQLTCSERERFIIGSSTSLIT